jgi:hypothetical protein
MAICAAACLPAAVSLLLLEALSMQISGVSLTRTWPLRLCLLKSSPGCNATATSFPLSKHTAGGDTAPTFSGLRVYLQLTFEVGLPPSPVELSSHRHFYKLSDSWLLGVCRSSCLLRPGLFIYSSVRDYPPSLFRAQGAPPSLLCVFFVISYYSVSLFFPGWGLVCPGGYADLTQGCLWEYCVPLSSPCGLLLPKWSGCWCLAAVWEPSWFLRLMCSGNITRGLGVWRSQSFASSQWFFLYSVSPASLQDFSLGGMLSASSL